MTALELEAKKYSLIRAIMDIEEEDLINALDALLNKSMPCVMTGEQIREQIKQGLEDQAAGKYRSHKDVMSKYLDQGI